MVDSFFIPPETQNYGMPIILDSLAICDWFRPRLPLHTNINNHKPYFNIHDSRPIHMLTLAPKTRSKKMGLFLSDAYCGLAFRYMAHRMNEYEWQWMPVLCGVLYVLYCTCMLYCILSIHIFDMRSVMRFVEHSLSRTIGIAQ